MVLLHDRCLGLWQHCKHPAAVVCCDVKHVRVEESLQPHWWLVALLGLHWALAICTVCCCLLRQGMSGFSDGGRCNIT